MFLISFSVFLRNDASSRSPTVKWLCNWIHDFMCVKRFPHKYISLAFFGANFSFSPRLRPVCRRRRRPPARARDAITALLSELFQRWRTSNNNTLYSLLYSFTHLFLGHCLATTVDSSSKQNSIIEHTFVAHPHPSSSNAHPNQHHGRWGRKKICLWHLTCADMMQAERPRERAKLAAISYRFVWLLATMAMTMTCFFTTLGFYRAHDAKGNFSD